MMVGATNVHSHDDGAAGPRPHRGCGGDGSGRLARPHVGRRRRGDTVEHAHTSEPATTTRIVRPIMPRPRGRARGAGLAAGLGPDGADRLLRRRRRHAPSSRRGPRPSSPTRCATCPPFADVTTLPALGYRSIGDAATGFEHYINVGYIGDDSFLDPTRPESLVYQVDGDKRTLVSAMFIAKDVKVDDPELVDWGGPLMQWHVHENLCWSLDENGKPKVVGVTDADGKCAPGSVNAGGENPMVHVWIAPHECGPFAALEGHGAGQAATDGQRVDQCAHGHGDEPAEDGGRAGHRRLRPDEADRPLRRRGRHARAAGVRREPRRRHRRAACRSGPTRPSPRPPASTRSATPRPATSTTSTGTGSTTTCGSTRTRPRASSTSRSRTARRSWCRRCTCCPQTVALADVPELGRAADAVARPRQPLLHRRPRGAAGARASRSRTGRAGRRSSGTRSGR